MGYQITPAGVVNTTTNEFVPDDPANYRWQEYQAWLAAGNTATPEPAPDLPTAKANAQSELERQAGVERDRWGPKGALADLWFTQRLAQAKLADADGTPTTGEYPLLDAEVGVTGVDLAAVADAVIAEWATLEEKLAGIATVYVTKKAAIASAANVGAVQTIVNGLAAAWPA